VTEAGAGSEVGAGPEGPDLQSDPRPARGWRGAVLAVVVVFAVLVPLTARVLVDGRAELAKAAAAATVGDVDGQLRHLGRAARWSMPLASHDDRARAGLQSMAVSAAESAGGAPSPVSLAAWRELRRALLGTRVMGVADDHQLAAANLGIVEEMAREAAEKGGGFDRARAAAALEAPLNSRPWASHLSAACLVGWLVALVGFAMRGVDGRGHVVARPATRWGGAVLVLLIAWLSTM